MKNQYLKLILAGVVAAFVCTSANAQTVDIWGEGQMQGRAAQSDALNERNMFCAVKTPTLELFLAKTDKPTGMVVIAPGGGYQILAYPHEGVQIAQWLNSCGISAAVLKYRVPNFPQEALADIQRAIRLARANAQKWNVKPDKIAVLGFSAGANLCARASTNYTKNAYTPLDEADKLSARPDATFLIYPAYCDQMGNERRWNKGKFTPQADDATLYKLAENLDVNKDTPPVFITQSLDDKNYINAGIAYFLAAKRAGVGANLHVFEKGGHGYGLAKGKDWGKWTTLAEDWLKAKGFKGE